MKSFCENYGLTNLIKQPTCYKNLANSTFIDLILTSVLGSFERLSDFHLMTMTVIRKSLNPIMPGVIIFKPKHPVGLFHDSKRFSKNIMKGNEGKRDSNLV